MRRNEKSRFVIEKVFKLEKKKSFTATRLRWRGEGKSSVHQNARKSTTANQFFTCSMPKDFLMLHREFLFS